ncbi:MAG: NmrA family NAD(P)-binding protein [Balneolaceae bacterium]
MILITGANGNLGTATIQYLLKEKPDADVAGLVRSEKKGAELKARGVDLKIGDYKNYNSMQKVMQDVDILLLISSSSLENRDREHGNVIRAAEQADVKHIFYTSIVQADKLLGPLSSDHFETEKMLTSTGIPYTIYRNTFYAEYLPVFMGNAIDTGEWYFPSDGKKINLALREEMAEALAKGLSKPGEHENQIYEITSANSYTLKEIAGMLQRIGNMEITYHDLSIGAFSSRLSEAGLPEDAVMMSTAVATTFVNGGLDFIYPDLENLLGRKPADLETVIKGYASEIT